MEPHVTDSVTPPYGSRLVDVATSFGMFIEPGDWLGCSTPAPNRPSPYANRPWRTRHTVQCGCAPGGSLLQREGGSCRPVGGSRDHRTAQRDSAGIALGNGPRKCAVSEADGVLFHAMQELGYIPGGSPEAAAQGSCLSGKAALCLLRQDAYGSLFRCHTESRKGPGWVPPGQARSSHQVCPSRHQAVSLVCQALSHTPRLYFTLVLTRFCEN